MMNRVPCFAFPCAVRKVVLMGPLGSMSIPVCAESFGLLAVHQVSSSPVDLHPRHQGPLLSLFEKLVFCGFWLAGSAPRR
jgi:hypothetical protein